MISVSALCAYLAFFFDSLSPIFEEHDSDESRLGSEQRLQLEGHLWKPALEAWLTNEEERKAFRERCARERRSATVAKKQKKADLPPSSDLPLSQDDYIEDKLWMGLNILGNLANAMHNGALNATPLKQEPGCDHLDETLNREYTSLLVSVPRKLEAYPGCKGGSLKWLGDKAVRFPSAQRARLPPDGAAPQARVRITLFCFLLDDDDQISPLHRRFDRLPCPPARQRPRPFMDMTEPARQVQGFGRGTGAPADEGCERLGQRARQVQQQARAMQAQAGTSKEPDTGRQGAS